MDRRKKAPHVACAQQLVNSGLRGKARWLAVWFALLSFSPSAAEPANAPQPDLSAESYIEWRGETLAPAGTLEIDGRRMDCGQYPTVLDPDYADFGGASARFLILNPQRFSGLATPVKLWIYSHECAHQAVGADEVKADCIAVLRGRREGWLTESGLEQICEFMRPARQDRQHFGGAQRCELMQKCFRQDNKPLRR